MAPIFRDPRFDALRNALYHTERRTFLDRLNKGLNFLVIVFGAGVAAKAARHLGIDDLWFELMVVVLATLQLVFDIGGLARDHGLLQKQYFTLLSEIENVDAEDDKIKKEWSAKLLIIAGEEPLTMRALDAVAYNKALEAVSDDPETLRNYRQHVPVFPYYVLRNLLAFHNKSFQSAR